jgi:heme-degrading monooxygenase HmoA
MPIAETPEPPYVAVIFTTRRTDDDEGYTETDARMVELAAEQPGFLGIESARDGANGITVSYWRNDGDARAWKEVAEHRAAQQLGRERWYRAYRLRVAHVERDYGFGRDV